MKTLNLGILAHVDAGKTSLSERLLYDVGLIPTLGSVDKGNTQTDTLKIEQQRGITIKSTVVSFDLENLKINLIDTPGHSEFVAEVERALSVLDAVILVISAVEGIQSQTLILANILQRLKIPTLIFINKIDRLGARSDELVKEIQTKLFPEILVLNTVQNIGTDFAKTFDIQNLPDPEKLKDWIGKMEICPIVFGSALVGEGVPQLLQALQRYFEPIEDKTTKPLSGKVFKLEIDTKGRIVAYARLFQGELKLRQQIPIIRINQNDHTELFGKITKIQGFKNGKQIELKTVEAPEIVKIWGLDLQIGDWLGVCLRDEVNYFARPNLSVIIRPKNPAQSPKLHNALKNLCLIDPLVSVEQNSENTLSLKLYGEIQQQIIQAFLYDDYGLEVVFEKTQVIYVEKVVGTGKAFAEKFAPDNLFIATLGISLKPGIQGSGIVFDIGIGRGHLPVAFQKAIEESVNKTLKQGLYCFEVIDCMVQVTDAGYDSVATDGGDFRGLTPILLQKALKQATTEIYEPINHFELEFPKDHLNNILAALVKAEAKIDTIAEESEKTIIKGTLPVRQTFDLERQIPNLTSGQGLFLWGFEGYQKYTNNR